MAGRLIAFGRGSLIPDSTAATMVDRDAFYMSVVITVSSQLLNWRLSSRNESGLSSRGVEKAEAREEEARKPKEQREGGGDFERTRRQVLALAESEATQLMAWIAHCSARGSKRRLLFPLVLRKTVCRGFTQQLQHSVTNSKLRSSQHEGNLMEHILVQMQPHHMSISIVHPLHFAMFTIKLVQRFRTCVLAARKGAVMMCRETCMTILQTGQIASAHQSVINQSGIADRKLFGRHEPTRCGSSRLSNNSSG